MATFSKILKGIANVPSDLADTLRMKPVQAFIWFTCWACWTLASMQYYFLPFTLSNLAKTFHVEQTKISEANTTSMLTRSIGAVIFGIAADQYGRKIPMLVDLLLLGVFTLSSGFVHTYGQLVGVRALFGIAYGGTYGMMMATLLEAVPRKARGIAAGFTQQGFAAGYLLASGFHLAMNPYGWRPLYWLGTGLTVPVMIITYLRPQYSVAEHAIEEAEGVDHVDARTAVGGNLSFVKKLKFVVRHHPKPFFYACALTACFNTMGHGAMDLYPTFLITQRGLNIKHETWVTCILQIGGVTGGAVGGYLSHRIHPRWVATVCILCCAPFLPLWGLSTSWGHLATGAFFLQFFYGCAIGNLGNLLQQLCPHPGMRAAFGGVAYNIGNAISSIAPTIETSLGERFPLKDGKPNYAKTQMILVGIMIGLLAITLASMPIKSLNKEWDEMDPNMTIPTTVHDISAQSKAIDLSHPDIGSDANSKSNTTQPHRSPHGDNDDNIASSGNAHQQQPTTTEQSKDEHSAVHVENV